MGYPQRCNELWGVIGVYRRTRLPLDRPALTQGSPLVRWTLRYSRSRARITVLADQAPLHPTVRFTLRGDTASCGVIVELFGRFGAYLFAESAFYEQFQSCGSGLIAQFYRKTKRMLIEYAGVPIGEIFSPENAV